MKASIFQRTAAAALALILAVFALPVTASAAENQADPFIELVATDVTLDETTFVYTGEAIKPNVTVRAKGQLLTLDKDYSLDYANNVEVGEAKVIVTGIATSGYVGTVEHTFFITEKAEQAPEFTLIELKDSDVAIEGTEFAYTGEAIEPKVTVTLEGKTLVDGKDYAVEYVNNMLPGTGTVIVRGIATASQTVGYTGEVRVDFKIMSTEETYPLVELKQEHVTINGKSFPYTGKAIEPEITVTVDGKVLTRGQDYSLVYKNNIEAGTGSAVISGIATATEVGGYTGEVTVKFTITASEPETPPETEAPKPEYKITKGSGSRWYQGSTTGLSFTADGKFEDFTGVSINGKLLDKDNYSAKSGSTIILLKNSYLKTLDTGKYTIQVHFEDGDAEGTFHIQDEAANPKTGDTIQPTVAVLFISLAGLIGAGFVYKKKLFK